MSFGDRQAGDELLGERRVVLDGLLGQPDTPDVERDGGLGFVGTEGELGRAAADVEHEERTVGRIEIGGGALELGQHGQRVPVERSPAGGVRREEPVEDHYLSPDVQLEIFQAVR